MSIEDERIDRDNQGATGEAKFNDTLKRMLKTPPDPRTKNMDMMDESDSAKRRQEDR